MTEIVFTHYDGVNNTPCVPLMAQAAVELQQAGLSSGSLVGSWDQQAILAVDPGDDRGPVGLITWEHIKWEKMVWIHLSFVTPLRRGDGIYGRLYGELLREAAGLTPRPLFVRGGVHVDNEPMIRAAMRYGRVPLFTVWSAPVPDDTVPVANNGEMEEP